MWQPKMSANWTTTSGGVSKCNSWYAIPTKHLTYIRFLEHNTHGFSTYSALGAFQLLSLLPKFFNYISANLICLSCNSVRALNALTGSVQTVCSLEKQHPL